VCASGSWSGVGRGRRRYGRGTSDDGESPSIADKEMAASKGGARNKDNSSYQRKMVILWIKAVMEPLPPLAPSSWKLISKSPRAQPKCSAE
jgi:hypothetical protein